MRRGIHWNKRGVSNRVLGALITTMVIAMLILSGPATAFDLTLSTPSDTTPTQGDIITFTASVEVDSNEIVPIQNLSLNFSDGQVCYFSVDGDILTPDDCTGLTITPDEDSVNYTNGSRVFNFSGSSYNYSVGFGYGYAAPGPSVLTYEISLDTDEFDTGELSFTLNAHLSSHNFASDEQSIDISAVEEEHHGGGGGAVTNPSTSQTWDQLASGTTQTMKVVNDDFGIDEITFNVNQDSDNAKIIIEKLSGKPSATMEIGGLGKIFKYLKITPVNINPSGPVKFKFTIPKSWLEQNGLKPEDIALNRYADGKWTSLPTTILSTEGDFISFEAESPGFSYFAIGTKAAAEELTAFAIIDMIRAFYQGNSTLTPFELIDKVREFYAKSK